MMPMKPSPTDINALPHFYHHLMPLTGLTSGQVHKIYLLAHRRLPPRSGRRWSLPQAVRVLLVLIHLRANLTTRTLAALFGASRSTVDRVAHHLIALLAQALRPESIDHSGPWIIDGTSSPCTISRSLRPRGTTPQHQHADNHQRRNSPRHHRRPMLARRPQRRHRRPPHHRPPTHRPERHPRRRRLPRHQVDYNTAAR